MEKFNFKQYDSSVNSGPFMDSSYTEPTGEQMTRKELSYPLVELKEFINEIASTNSEDKVIRFRVTETGVLQYSEDGLTWTAIHPGTAEGTYVTDNGLPDQGETNDILVKNSDDDYDAGWTSLHGMLHNIDTAGTITDEHTLIVDDGSNLKKYSIGDLLDQKGFTAIGTQIPNGSDLDDYTIPGIYWGSDASTMTNCPSSSSVSFVLKVFSTYDSIEQWLMLATSTYRYSRRKTSGTWYSWFRDVLKNINPDHSSYNVIDFGTAIFKGTLDLESQLSFSSGTGPLMLKRNRPSEDYNDFTTTGWYYMDSSTHTNYPGSTATTAGYLFVLAHASSYCVQLFTSTGRSSFVIYGRKCQSGTWGEWKSVTFA